MRNMTSKLIAFFTALMLCVCTLIHPALADTTTNNANHCSFETKLVVDADSIVPDIDFDYTIVAGTAVAKTSTNDEIKAGVGSPTVSSAQFSNAHSTAPGTPTDASDTTKKYATASATVDFSSVTFTEPGTYRYKITQTPTTANGVNADASPDRYLDVFVVTDGTNLSISSFALRKTADNISGGTYSTGSNAKNEGYINSIDSYDLIFTKAVSGNQAVKTKEFSFTINVTGANPGTYRVVCAGVTSAVTQLPIGENTGSGNFTVSLKDGSSVTVQGLNKDAVCVVSEDSEDYVASYKVNGAEAVSNATTGQIDLTQDTTVAFTNTREGVIPTGVIVSVAPFAIGIMLSLATILFVVSKRRRDEYV